MIVVGGAGNSLNGGAGLDRLIGGTGDDTMTGGSDKDTFVFDLANGLDTITDFKSGQDKIDLTAFAAEGIHAFDQLDIASAGGNTTISFGAADQISLIGASTLKAKDVLLA